MLEIEKLLYHGLNRSVNSDVDVFEKILKSGFIMTRASLQKYLKFSEWSKFLSLHKAN